MASAERLLVEREKELASIYSICLLAAGGPEVEAAAEGIARALVAAMQREDQASCVVDFRHPASGRTVRVVRGDPPPAGNAEADAFPLIEAALRAEGTSGGWEGSIRVTYRDASLAFLPQEKALLGSVLVVASSMLRTSSLIADLRATSADLSAKNIALREVLSAIEDQRRRSLRALRERLAAEILPLAERARDASLTEERRADYLRLLVDELGRDISAFGGDPASDIALSPREREIAVQVRNGRTSKEIAELLGIALATVERHRHNLRRKLGIAGKSANLAGLLANEDSAVSSGETL